MEKKIEYMVVSVTGYCNMSCKGCFRVDKDSMMTLDTYKSLYPTFEELGVKCVNYTGGEPLLNVDLLQFLQLSREWGYKNILSSNGMMVDASNVELMKYVDVLALSLDGDNRRTNDNYRIEGHFDSTLRLIDRVYHDFPDVKIKINTLVTAHNSHNVLGIGDILSEYGDRINCWKLFQISSRGLVNSISDSDKIADDVFLDLCSNVKAKYGDIIHVTSQMADADIQYCIVRCDGSLNILHNDEYITVDKLDAIPFDSNSYNETSLGL